MDTREPSRRAWTATKSMEGKNNGFHCERDVFNENDISRHLYNLVEDYLSKIREIWGPPSKYSPNLLLNRTSLVDKASDGIY